MHGIESNELSVTGKIPLIRACNEIKKNCFKVMEVIV